MIQIIFEQNFNLANGSISWNSKKQPTIALSTVEAKYMAATQAIKDIGYAQKGPTIIWSDNKISIALAKTSTYHACTKHIDRMHHFVCESLADGEVQLKFCGTQEMVPDILTKGLTCESKDCFKVKIGVVIVATLP